MALPPLVKKRAGKYFHSYCERKVPLHVRNKVRLTFGFRGNSLTLIEERESYFDKSIWTKSPVAQFRYRPESGEWTLYCRDRNLRWHQYSYARPTNNLEGLIGVIDADVTGIFWG